MVDVYCRLLDLKEPFDKTNLTPATEGFMLIHSHAAAPTSAGKIAWAAVGSRLLECIEDNFLSEVIAGPTRRNAGVDLMVTSASQLVGGLKIGGSLCCSDHTLVEFAALGDVGQTKSKVRTLNFGKAKLQLYKKLVSWTHR